MKTLIGEKIKHLRKQNNTKQSELAKGIGVSDKTISNWETGLTEPSEALKLKIAKYYNMTISDLYKDTESREYVDAVNMRTFVINAIDEKLSRDYK